MKPKFRILSGIILTVLISMSIGGISPASVQGITASEIVLFEGWNLISLPFTPEDQSIAVVLADILDNVESVWAFDGDTKIWSSYSPGAPSDLTEMVEEKGYWIKVKMDTILTIHIESTEGIVTEIETSLGNNLFIYTEDEFQVGLDLPTYLGASTTYNKSKSKIDVYLKPLVSLSGIFNVDMEFGVKISFPIFGIYAFVDVDVTWLGDFKPDIFTREYSIYGLSSQSLNLDEGDIGIYSISIPTESGTVSLESLPVGEWNQVASYNVYVVMEPTIVSLGLTTEDITIGPVGEDTEESTIYFVGSIDSDVYHTLYCYYVDFINEENKVYFYSVEEAEIAGYRPCLVCNP